MIIVFTGNGKGKTTAALGQMVRSVGRGKRALMVQFIKGPWKSGEDEFVKKLKAQSSKSKSLGEDTMPDFEIKKMGLGFVGILGDTLPRERHEQAARKALNFATSEMEKGNWDLVILDEVNVAISLNLLTTAEVLAALADVPPEKLVICTGRGAPQELIDRADLVTEMKEIKHPFNDGKMAKIAVEF